MHTARVNRNRQMGGVEWALLALLAVLWGGSYFFVEVAIRQLPPLTIVVARVALGAVVLLVLGRLTGLRLPTDRRLWAMFAVMGLLNNVIPFTLIAWGQTHIFSGVASILNATTPLFTVAIAHMLTDDEKLTGSRLIGIMLGLGGVAVMVGSATIRALGVQIGAQLAVLAAACSYALAGVFGRQFNTRGITPMATATGQVTASSILLLPVMLIVDRPWQMSLPSLPTIGALVGLAALSTAAAYTIYFRLLASAGATNLLLVTFLIPVTAILLGISVLGETILPRHLVGMMLIGCGLAAIDGRPWDLLRRTITLSPTPAEVLPDGR